MKSRVHRKERKMKNRKERSKNIVKKKKLIKKRLSPSSQ